MKFTKMQGCGNDYIYINCFEEETGDAPELAKRLSDRHFGIGGDGIILIKPSDKADFFMDMYNLDGSRGMMCGNAIRCVGKYVSDRGMTDKTDLEIETLSGIRYLRLNRGADGKVESARVDMGSPVTEPAKIPVKLDVSGPVKDFRLEVPGYAYDFTFVSMGNPHAVTFTQGIDTLEIEKPGPLFEFHEMFPERANIEFVERVDRSHIRMRVWERGSGETFACGTGACASAYAAMLCGFCDRKVEVEMRGGRLEIEYDAASGHIFMTGPAIEVFSGEIVL